MDMLYLKISSKDLKIPLKIIFKLLKISLINFKIYIGFINAFEDIFNSFEYVTTAFLTTPF